MARVETESNTRRLKRLSAFTATLFLAAACSAPVDANRPTPSSESQAFPQNTEVPAPIIIYKTPTPQESPTPPETVENTIENQAKKVTVNYWIDNVLNSGTQKTKEEFLDGTTFIIANILKVEATNLKDWQDQKDLILSGRQSSNPLQISWAGGSYGHKQSSKDGTSVKDFGQIEINNAQIASESVLGISNADSANGITWHELIKINYLERIHTKQYQTVEGNYKKIKSWVTQFDNENLPEISPWYQSFYEAELTLQNEKWIIKQSQYSSRTTRVMGIQGFTVPYDVKKELDGTCGNSCVVDFKPITVK